MLRHFSEFYAPAFGWNRVWSLGVRVQYLLSALKQTDSRLNGAPVPKDNNAQAVKNILRGRSKGNGFAYHCYPGSTIGLTGCAVLCLE